jgi:hypothetical protein
MIKIIKPGTKKKINCDACGCLFSYEKEDVGYGDIANVFPMTAIGMYVTCPQCKEKIVLEGIVND